MPTVEFNLADLKPLLGREINREELEDLILYVKGEVEDFYENEVKIDLKDTNRPDLWSVEGIARELKGHLGIEEGIPNYKVNPPEISMIVSKKVERVRAKTVAAVVKNLSFDEESIRQIIQLQEKIHLTYGRNRHATSIGIYDYDKIVPPIHYTTVEPEGIKFVPLDFEEELTPKEILEKHPKGREYGHLIKKYDEYPLMIDSKGNVLSIPPIINSAYTGKITEETKNVFIEMTGHSIETLLLPLNVIVTALADRGGKIYSVEVKYPEKTIVTPDLTPKKFEINLDYCRKILGLSLTDEEIIALLKRARYDIAEKNKSKLVVYYPAYRNDIMHQRDVVEDIAIAYNLNNMEPETPKLPTIGRGLEIEEFCDTIREIMIGLGFQEIMTFSLTNKENLFVKMNIAEEKVCEIANPVSSSWTALRNWLIPSLLEFLSRNKHVDFPQKIFEVGDVVIIDETRETKTKTIRKLACAISDSKVSYEEISSSLDALMRNLGIEYKLRKTEHASFIPGRVAKIIANGKEGVIGEIHPRVLNNWKLEKPVVAFEMEIGRVA